MLRILHILKTLDFTQGGVPVAVSGLARALSREGCFVTVAVIDGAGSNVALDELINVKIFSRDIWQKLDYSRGLNLFVRQNVGEFDIVHSHLMYSASSLTIGDACNAFGVPLVLSPHGMFAPHLLSHHAVRKLVADLVYHKRGMAAVDLIHFTTSVEKEWGLVGGLKKDFFVAPIGVNVSDYAIIDEANAFSGLCEQGTKVILYLGRLNFKKGLDILIDSYSIVVSEYSAVHLVIAGPDDGMENEMRAAVERKGLAGKVSFVGMVTGARKVAMLQQAHVFVLPSYSENFGIAVIEALAAGTPVIISDQVGVHREVATAGVGLVGPCNAAAFAGMMIQMLGPDSFYASIKCKLNCYAESCLDWKPIALKYLAVYRGVIQKCIAHSSDIV